MQTWTQTGYSHLLQASVLLGRFLILRMELTRSSEMSVHMRTTRRHVSEDGNSHNHRRQNLKFYKRKLDCTSNKKNPWLLVRKRTIPTERPPIFGEF
jgi:hypothetical protein